MNSYSDRKKGFKQESYHFIIVLWVELHLPNIYVEVLIPNACEYDLNRK